MTGGDDAKAAEAAELHALHRRAEERRQELGETLAALTARVSESTDLRALARREVRHAASAAGHAAVSAARRALPLNGTAPAPLGQAGASRRARAVMTVAVPTALAAMAAWWWWHSTNSTRRAGRRGNGTGW